eukprot:1395008-Amorphochlora_amoeboformis.AAC.2
MSLLPGRSQQLTLGAKQPFESEKRQGKKELLEKEARYTIIFLFVQCCCNIHRRFRLQDLLYGLPIDEGARLGCHRPGKSGRDSVESRRY